MPRNRVWLMLTGLVLFGAGGVVLSIGCIVRGAALHSLASAVPGNPRFWPVVGAVSCTVTMLGYAWLSAQWRCRTLRRLAIGHGASSAGPVTRVLCLMVPSLRPAAPRGATRMGARVATRAIAADVASYPGVHRVRTRLCGSSRRPRIRLRVTCETGADLGELVPRVRDDAMVRLRTTLGRADLGGVVDFHLPPENPSWGRRVR